MAGVLLSVEDSLDDQLVRLILPAAGHAASAEAPPDQDFEFRQVSEAVLRECIVNLARIKEAVSIAVQKPADFPPQGLDNVPQLLRGITAGLLMLGKVRAVELMDAIGGEVRKLIEPGAPAPDALRLERVADAIVSIEYYMETLQNGRNDPWYMLDNAETCMKALAEQAPSRVPEVELPHDAAASTMRLDPEATIAIERAKRAQASTHPLTATPVPDAVDPQFLELFIEEAKEEIASIQKSFPLWDQNPMDLESLGSLRRSFHTLKGSGRMVGARLIAEFGWSIENLLNRIIDKTLSRTPGNDGPAAQCRCGFAPARGAAGNRQTQSGSGGCHHGARLCLRGRPGSGAGGRGLGARRSQRRVDGNPGLPTRFRGRAARGKSGGRRSRAGGGTSRIRASGR